MENIIEQIRKELIKNSDEKIRISGKRFFKEEIKSYGVKSAIVNTISKNHLNTLKQIGKEKSFEMCEDLWKSAYLEEAIIACNWSYKFRKEYVSNDFKVFEKWVNLYVTNWAACDTLCNHTIGTFVEMYPEYLNNLMKWTTSSNIWVRRAAAVSLIIPAREGKFLKHIFEIANALLMDKQDLVQKGYGWMLKAASKPFQDEVFSFVMKNKSVMPRTALRYAIEKLPNEWKQKAMDK